MSFLLNIVGVAALISLVSCYREPVAVSPDAAFGAPQSQGTITSATLTEVSGLVASRSNAGMLWAHNDSGHEPSVLLIDQRGQLRAIYQVDSAKNYDWEDIAIGPGPEPDKTYLYVGDVGDNNDMYDERYVYRFAEPVYQPHHTLVRDTIVEYDRLGFFYRDRAVNVETLLLDPTDQTLYVLTKESGRADVYAFDFPAAAPFRREAKIVGSLSLGGAGLTNRLVGGDISPDGQEVLLKTYEHVLYWSRRDTILTIPALLQLPPDTLPYRPEPQGEAIGFAADGSGYYTLSEENFGVDIDLYFYPRQATARVRVPPNDKKDTLVATGHDDPV